MEHSRLDFVMAVIRTLGAVVTIIVGLTYLIGLL